MQYQTCIEQTYIAILVRQRDTFMAFSVSVVPNFIIIVIIWKSLL